jgi:hypothetical protein
VGRKQLQRRRGQQLTATGKKKNVDVQISSGHGTAAPEAACKRCAAATTKPFRRRLGRLGRLMTAPKKQDKKETRVLNLHMPLACYASSLGSAEETAAGTGWLTARQGEVGERNYGRGRGIRHCVDVG